MVQVFVAALISVPALAGSNCDVLSSTVDIWFQHSTLRDGQFVVKAPKVNGKVQFASIASPFLPSALQNRIRTTLSGGLFSSLDITYGRAIQVPYLFGRTYSEILLVTMKMLPSSNLERWSREYLIVDVKRATPVESLDVIEQLVRPRIANSQSEGLYGIHIPRALLTLIELTSGRVQYSLPRLMTDENQARLTALAPGHTLDLHLTSQQIERNRMGQPQILDFKPAILRFLRHDDGKLYLIGIQNLTNY